MLGREQAHLLLQVVTHALALLEVPTPFAIQLLHIIPACMLDSVLPLTVKSMLSGAVPPCTCCDSAETCCNISHAALVQRNAVYCVACHTGQHALLRLQVEALYTSP